MDLDLYVEIKLATESYLYGNPNVDEREIIDENLELFLTCLKSKKKDVEYQFAAHKFTCQSYHNEYVQKTLNKNDYFDLILGEKQWRSKAVSFLCRIENAILETKVRIKQCQNKVNEMNS